MKCYSQGSSARVRARSWPPGRCRPRRRGGERALGEPGGALGSTGEMKGKRMNHTVSGETHESYIVSADLTDPTRISRAGGASGARSPKARSCGGVAPGNQGPTRDPPAPLSSPQPFAPRGLSHVWGKPSSGSSWHPNEGDAHGWLPAPGVRRVPLSLLGSSPGSRPYKPVPRGDLSLAADLSGPRGLDPGKSIIALRKRKS